MRRLHYTQVVWVFPGKKLWVFGSNSPPTKWVDSNKYGISQSMGYHSDGLRQSRLYIFRATEQVPCISQMRTGLSTALGLLSDVVGQLVCWVSRIPNRDI